MGSKTLYRDSELIVTFRVENVPEKFRFSYVGIRQLLGSTTY